MDDLISRQAAIDALNGEIEITGRTNAEAVKGYVQLVKDRLERLPSAQPEQRWIPCSERLPEDSGWYIVTKELDYDTTFVGLEWYDSTNGWKYDNAKCIAWMPLPEPYKGEQE